MAATTPIRTTESTPSIGIKAEDLKAINAGLSQVLADTFTLYLKTHGYHWNVTGPHFRSLHLLFEEQYQELWAAADVLAERMRALGSGAPGSYAEFLEHASIKDNERTADAMTMVANLGRDHETLARLIRPLVEVAEDAGDGATADLFNARLAVHEQAAWMLRSFAA
ncbi:Dps family protein [Demequina mangrovi]|uniref:Starvation-inducible DNA-binding protein n=1 Tax=Demequina mangrovi TaxID=1043493 RepID=A0A1H7AQ40_9MICO|nr:Dps family protein [Demequina mangrovi]SEJ67713.1 starvation-inducible DNA-binding protein [Demequina mangrovi]